MFGFLCPSRLSPVAQFKKGEMNKAMEDRMDRVRYIANVFSTEAARGRVFLAPYNVGHHWVLCVIDPYSNIVYYMDPLHNGKNKGTGNGVCDDLRALIETAILLFQSEKGMQKKIKLNAKWLQIQCPRQQNTIDCGYFVMRFMKEIIEHKQTQLQEDYFFDCAVATYEQGQIDEVRIDLARQIFLLV